jgi:hypothetical protein
MLHQVSREDKEKQLKEKRKAGVYEVGCREMGCRSVRWREKSGKNRGEEGSSMRRIPAQRAEIPPGLRFTPGEVSGVSPAAHQRIRG